jgi:hypothetical protein
MKKSKNYLSFFAVLLVLSFLTSCKEDEEETNNDYSGTWKSRVYPSMTNPLISEQMVFTFTNTTFEDKVYQGASATSLNFVSGMKGGVAYTAPSTIDVEVNEISVMGAPYIDKNVDETSFYTYFNATMGQLIYEEFTATYTMSGDTMTLSLPMKNPAGGADIPASMKLIKQAE